MIRPSHISPSEAARILGSLGGSATKGITTRKKARASRENGKLGGRPKKKITKAA